MNEAVGQRLGKYEVTATIGSGGFGTVYRARDVDLDRPVALKVLHPALLRDPAFVERFHQEARAAAALDHPHIVTVYEVGEAEGRQYIAMRWLEGQPLSRLLYEHEGPLPPGEVLSILADIASALDYAHEHGIVHRDVKPSNIIVTSSGAMLTDFGIAHMATGGTMVTTGGQVMGTPEYMAPEQILGRPVCPQTDIYALGIVAYQMLTSKVPFSGATPFAVQRGHVDDPVPPASVGSPGMPREIDAVLERALAKNPVDRYQDGVCFATALRQAILSEDHERSATVSGTEHGSQDIIPLLEYAGAESTATSALGPLRRAGLAAASLVTVVGGFAVLIGSMLPWLGGRLVYEFVPFELGTYDPSCCFCFVPIPVVALFVLAVGLLSLVATLQGARIRLPSYRVISPVLGVVVGLAGGFPLVVYLLRQFSRHDVQYGFWVSLVGFVLILVGLIMALAAEAVPQHKSQASLDQH